MKLVMSLKRRFVQKKTNTSDVIFVKFYVVRYFETINFLSYYLNVVGSMIMAVKDVHQIAVIILVIIVTSGT